MNTVDIINRIQQHLFGIFNTRELANITWILLGICVALLYPSLRKSILGVLKSLFVWKFVLICIIAFAYIGFTVKLLDHFGFWNLSLLKETIYWTILTGLTCMYNIAGSKEPLGDLKNVLKTSFKISVIINFIVNLETFSFWIELTAIPVVLFLTLVVTASKYKKVHVSVATKIENSGRIVAIIVFGYTLYVLAINFWEHFNVETGKEFLLPIIMTITFIPVLALLNLFVQYEDISDTLSRRTKDGKQYYLLLLMALVYFNFNIKGLRRWLHTLTARDLATTKEIIASMKRIQFQQKQEGIPPEFPELEGWRPDYAKAFLADKELGITSYSSDLGTTWTGSSKTKLDKDFWTGDCVYSIHGTRFVVDRLRLHFQAFDSSRTQDLRRFAKVVDTLYDRVLHVKLPRDIRSSILNLRNLEHKVELGHLSIRLNRWKNKTRGYDLYIDIRHFGSVRNNN